MIYFIVVVLGVGIFEVRNMLKSGLKQEAIVWISMAVFTLAFGIYYLLNPFGNSLSYILLHMFGINY